MTFQRKNIAISMCWREQGALALSADTCWREQGALALKADTCWREQGALVVNVVTCSTNKQRKRKILTWSKRTYLNTS